MSSSPLDNDPDFRHLSYGTTAEAGTPIDAATRDALVLIRMRVECGNYIPSVGDCILMNAALHLEGRHPSAHVLADLPDRPEDK